MTREFMTNGTISSPVEDPLFVVAHEVRWVVGWMCMMISGMLISSKMSYM